MKIEILDTDTLFTDSPDVGSKACLCSRCMEQITEEDGPAIRCWPQDETEQMDNTEYRYHIKCLE